MPAKRLSMRKIKDVLRLKASNMSIRQISRPTVSDYLHRSEQAGLFWPIPDSLTDAALESALFPSVQAPVARDRQPPDWAQIHTELKRIPMQRRTLSVCDIDLDQYSCSFARPDENWVTFLLLDMVADVLTCIR